MALAACRTYVAHDIRSLIRSLTKLPSQLSVSDEKHTLLFSLAPSPDVSQNDLSELVQALNAHPRTVGCLSASHHELLEPRAHQKRPTHVSIAAFHRHLVVPFRSTIPGKEPTQVGRWHAFRKREDATAHAQLPEQSTGVDWERIWAKKETAEVPPELEELSADDAEAIVYLSDNAPEGLAHSLAKFRHASKLGLIASSTPFITGRPFTLFYNGGVHSSGAVGLCVKRPPSRSAPNAQLSVAFPPNLRAITELCSVTSTDGNLVHALDGKNPSRLILSRIQNLSDQAPAANVDASLLIKEEDEFYLGVHRGDEAEPYQLYRITAGDPSRGTIALQSDAAPEVGSTVKVYRSSPEAEKAVSLQPGLNFVNVRATTQLALPWGSTGVAELADTFVATTENGFIVSRESQHARERPWKCTVGGGHAYMQ